MEKWSRKHDPDGMGWRYQEDPDAFPSKIYVPIVGIEGVEEEQQSEKHEALEVVRDRTLAKLKLGKQSQGAKAISEFIKELRG